jgi:hypothetical protein
MKKYAKMLGLAAVAAMALMAVVGASSAAASAKVCSTQSGGQAGAACTSPHGNEYTTGKLVAETTTAAGQKATLTSGFITVTCDSKIEGEVTHGGSGTITTLDFTDCHSNLNPATNSCTANIEGAPYAMTATSNTATQSPNGTLDINSKVGGNFTCSGEKCIYSAASAGTLGEIVVTGGETAIVHATKVPLTKQAGSGPLCSGTSNWDGTYTVETPDSLFLT